MKQSERPHEDRYTKMKMSGGAKSWRYVLSWTEFLALEGMRNHHGFSHAERVHHRSPYKQPESRRQADLEFTVLGQPVATRNACKNRGSGLNVSRSISSTGWPGWWRYRLY